MSKGFVIILLLIVKSVCSLFNLDLLPPPEEFENELVPNFIICGQDLILSDLSIVTLFCPVQNDSDLLIDEIFKDGLLINGSYLSSYGGFLLLFSFPDHNIFGTYTFVVSTERCGYDFAVSRILHPGQLMI